MSEDYGTIRLGGDDVPLTGRGYVVFLIIGGAIIAGAVWLVLTVAIFAFSPLYG